MTGGWAWNGFQAVTPQFASVFMDLWVAGAGTDVIVGIELFGGTNGIWGGTLGQRAAAGESCITRGQNEAAWN